MNNGLVQREEGIDQKMILKITTTALGGSLDKSGKKEKVLMFDIQLRNMGLLICYYMNSTTHVNLGATYYKTSPSSQCTNLHSCSNSS